MLHIMQSVWRTLLDKVALEETVIETDCFNGGRIIETIKYADDLVLLAKEDGLMKQGKRNWLLKEEAK